MGSGKSTLSHLLSKKTGYSIIDCDSEIEKSEGMSISEIFSAHGESYFRALEKSFLEDLSCDSTIISTGGGMILQEDNVIALMGLGHVIYLSGTLDTLVSRLLSGTENRPLLDETSLRSQVSDLLSTREILYQTSCDDVVEIDGKSPEEIVSEIYGILSEIDYNFSG
nr:shikimate kinase [Acidaminobacter sp. JC074]